MKEESGVACECSLVVELQLPKLVVWVRFPSLAPKQHRDMRGCVVMHKREMTKEID